MRAWRIYRLFLVEWRNHKLHNSICKRNIYCYRNGCIRVYREQFKNNKHIQRSFSFDNRSCLCLQWFVCTTLRYGRIHFLFLVNRRYNCLYHTFGFW